MYWAHDEIYEDNSGNLFTGEYICRTGYLSGHNILDDPAAKLLNHTYIWHEDRGNDWVREVHINNDVKYDYRSIRKITCNYDQLFKEADNMILCNNIEKYVDLSYIENGNLYYEEDGEICQHEIYQFFIIDNQLADVLSRHTNEIILYSEDLDVYVLGVTHFGTAWTHVPSEWIINKQRNK